MGSSEYSLSKTERISGRSDIDKLFKQGLYFRSASMLVCYCKSNSYGTNRMMVSVPKKLFKRAVKRNLIKRRIKEAYRLQKHTLKITNTDILFIYKNKEVLDFSIIFEQLSTCIEILNRTIDVVKVENNN